MIQRAIAKLLDGHDLSRPRRARSWARSCAAKHARSGRQDAEKYRPPVNVPSRGWTPDSAVVKAVAAASPEWPHGVVRVRAVARIGADYGLSGGHVYRVRADSERGGLVSFVVKREGRQAVERALRFHRAVGSRVGGSVAALLGGLVDPETDTGVLVLEDVAPAKQGDVLAACTDPQALAAVRSLARVHAASRTLINEDHAKDVPRWHASATTHDVWEARLSAAAMRFPEILTASVVDRLHGLSRTVKPATESLQQRDACWIHCDAHLDNVLFRPDGRAVLLDWSGAAIGPAAVDLARVLTEGVNAGDRSERAGDLIVAYVNQLDAGGAEAMIGDPWAALSDGLAPLVQAAIAWAARDETREPRTRMRALQANLLRSVCSWTSNEHLTKPGRIFA